MWLGRLSPFLISFAVTCTFFINFCAWIFQCGCHALWAGADLACNIHAQHGRHCPWCSHGRTGYAIAMTLVCLPQLVVSLRSGWSWPIRTMVATAMFPAAGSVLALLFGWIDRYWVP